MDRKTFLATTVAAGLAPAEAVRQIHAVPQLRKEAPITATLYIQPDGTIQVLNFIQQAGSIQKVVYPCLSLDVALATLKALAEGRG